MRRATAVGWLTLAVAFVLVCHPPTPAVFWVSYVCCRSADYGLLDMIDRSLVASCRGRDAERHASRAAVSQMAGIVAAPAWFASWGRGRPQALGLALALSGCWWLSRTLGPVVPSQGRSAFSSPRSGGRPVLFLVTVLAVVTVAGLFTSGAVLIVASLGRLPAPIVDTGWLLTAMNLSAAIGAFGAAGLRRDLLVGASLGLCLCTLRLWLGVGSFGMLLVVGIGAGLCYGAFEVGARREATWQQRRMNDGRSLEVFNNGVNYATVFASLLMLGASWASGGRTASIGQKLCALLAGLAALAALSAFTLERFRRFRQEGDVS
ncbi:MAG: hypothetical protein OWU84_01460 [Firmicutes bacterium]|nr:hypothetical protein [Bacillota bacterium]